MIDNGHLLLQSVIIPIIATPLVYAIGKSGRRDIGWIAFIPLAYVLGLQTFLVTGLFTGGIPGSLEASYPWAPFIGDFTLLADGLSAPISFTITLLCTLIAVYSIPYMESEKNIGAYYALYILYTAGMIGTVLTVNLAAFFLFFELMLLPSWALIGVWGTGRREAIAFKYFMFTEAGALVLLAGILATGYLAGTFDIFQIAVGIDGVSQSIITGIVTLILIGLFVKMAIFPLHTWLPDAHAEAPTPISALLSPAMIGIGGYAAIRILYTSFPHILDNGGFLLSVVALSTITIFYGGFMAYAQDDMKRLLAYSSISQMGYLLFGVASVSVLGLAGASLLYVSHGFAKAILFMVSGVFMHSLGTRSISKLGGLARKMPYTATATLIGFLSLAGTPPLLGFWGEIFIFAGSMQTGLAGAIPLDLSRVWLTALAVAGSVFTAGYGLWAFRRIFFGEVKESLSSASEASSLMLGPIVIIAALLVLLGLYPTPLSKIIAELASTLLA